MKKKLSLVGFLEGLVIFAGIYCFGHFYDPMRLRSIHETEILIVNEAQAYYQAHGCYPAETKAQYSSLWSGSIRYAVLNANVEHKDGSEAIVTGVNFVFDRTIYILNKGKVSGPSRLD